MWHFWDWSIYSVYQRLRYPDYNGMNRNDIKYYSTLPVYKKTVLDAGAYTGDSARLFLSFGARKVICVEKEKEFADQINLPNVEVLNESFRPEHLDLADCAKLDIEGYEGLLIGRKISKPVIVEVHNGWMADEFRKMGFREVFHPRGILNMCLMVNY